MNVHDFNERRAAPRSDARFGRVLSARVLRAVGRLAAASVAAALLAGCAGIEPWERDVLARPDMQLVADPTEVAVDEHIYFSKEASSGGQGFGGGGCGCN